MAFYLRKHWKINTVILLIQIAWAATMVLPNVVMMQLAQGIVDGNLKMFVFWLVVDLGIYSLCGGLECIRGWAKSKAIPTAVHIDLPKSPSP